MSGLSDAALAHLREVVEWPDLSDTRYRLVARVGGGGMGTVYRARDVSLQRDVAIKVVRAPATEAGLATRLRQEARILAHLEHPGIVPVHDVGTLPDGRVFYVMKLVEGQPLSALATASLTLAERLRIFGRVCEAVAFAHARGVIHRDLKPSNIMVGRFGEVLVLDWGVARVSGTWDPAAESGDGEAEGLPRGPADDTVPGTILGTPGYMAPEQAAGRVDQIDARTDVYALGGLLRGLVRDGGMAASAGADGPPPLVAIARKAAADRPADRYASVQALADDVSRYAAGLAISAYRERVWERAARFVRRHRTAVLLVVAYLVMRILLLIFGRI